MKSKRKRTVQFRVSKHSLERLEETMPKGMTRRQRVSELVSEYSERPFGFIEKTKTHTLEAPLSVEQEELLTREANKAGISLGNALSQIVDELVNETAPRQTKTRARKPEEAT